MAELKTKPNDLDVNAFLDQVEKEGKRKDSYRILEMMKKVTGAEPRMWGHAIIGFGDCQFQYASGRMADWFLTGFSPRKQSLSLYIMAGFSRHKELMGKLGKFKTGKGCLYINKLDDVDLNVLEELISNSVEHLKNKYPDAG